MNEWDSNYSASVDAGSVFLDSFCEGEKIILVKFIIMYVKNIFVMKDQIDLFKCKLCM